jgi:putative membrane protein
MTASAALAFLHHAAAFVLVATLVVELVLLKGELTVTYARSVLRMDAAYGVSATALLIVGFLRVFYTEKGAAYYFASGPFIVKIVLFAIVGLLSIYPTVHFLRWRPALRNNQPPVLDDARRRTLRMIIHTELTLLFAIMLCAALMARGIGYFGHTAG